jgi:hypothetical protein
MYDVTQAVAVQVKNGCFDAIFRNTGSKPWPKGCSLQLIGGAAACGTKQVEFDYAVEAGEMIHVALRFDGDASSRWVFCTPDGKTFGCFIEVLNENANSADEESMENKAMNTGASEPQVSDDDALMLNTPDVELDDWEEVENVNVSLAVCVALAHLRQRGYEDDALNAYLLSTYALDVDKVERVLEVMRTESMCE